ncbi:hypothetical protein C0073_019790 [Aeromonas veronii]|nr:hypothetical protein C0073_019790 [Aeromonas veronii]
MVTATALSIMWQPASGIATLAPLFGHRRQCIRILASCCSMERLSSPGRSGPADHSGSRP